MEVTSADVTSHASSCDITDSRANKSAVQSESICRQPAANGTLPHLSTEEAPPPPSDRSEDGDSIDDSTNDVCRLLPSSTLRKHKGVDTHTCSLHHQGANQRPLSTKSPASKTDAAQIKEVAGDDCCVHCLLACLFCELLSMCSALGECLACGVGGASCCDVIGCCSCVEEAGGGACQAAMDCGIVEGCCGSSDCLEICLECCSICFPA